MLTSVWAFMWTNGKYQVVRSAYNKDRVMYHCTLLFSTDLDALNAALNGDPDAESRLRGSRTMRAVPSVRSEVANIKRVFV